MKLKDRKPPAGGGKQPSLEKQAPMGVKALRNDLMEKRMEPKRCSSGKEK